MGKFVVFTSENGMRFHLRAGNGETIATSEVYTTMASCRSGMESIRKCAPKAKLEDLLTEKKTAVSNPKFQIFLDKGGAYRFRLRARNGQVIASSQPYTSRDACLTGIDSVRVNALDAIVEFEEE